MSYSANPVPFNPTLLQSDAPGVFAILNLEDDAAAPISLGGNQFNFYGTNYSSLFASSNGLLTFGSANGSSANSDLRFSPTQAAIAPLWSDWLKDSGSPMILGQIDGSQLIIQWDELLHFDSAAPVTFQAVFELNTGTTPGDITINYIAIDTGDIHANGATSTVGIKAGGPQGANRLLVSFNATNTLIGDGKALQFAWQDANPPPTINVLSPAAAFEGSSDLLLTVGGTNFLNGSVVHANGVPLATTFVSTSQLQTTLPASFLLTIGAVTITVHNAQQISNPQTFSVLDAPLNGQGEPFTVVEGALFEGVVATFTDLNPNSQPGDFSATITWGDDNITQGIVTSDGSGGFRVTGTNTYRMLGSYSFSVQIVDLIGGASTTVFGAATVLDAPLTAQGFTIKGTVKGGFLGVVATFTDANPFGKLGDYVATITWGDGSTSPGRISLDSNGGFQVAGGHTYGKPGLYPYSVAITDTIGGATSSATGAAAIRVDNPTLHLDLRQNPNGRKVELAAAFSGLPPGRHKAKINWGDGEVVKLGLGTTSDGSLMLNHKYGPWFAWMHRKSGTDIRITLLNEDGSIAAAQTVHIYFQKPIVGWATLLATAPKDKK
jgi:hypothetical protein